MTSPVQRLGEFWDTQTAQAIRTIIVLGLSAYNLLYGTGMFSRAAGIAFLAVGLLMLYNTLVK